MVQFSSSPYQGAPLYGLGQLVKTGLPATQVTPGPEAITTGQGAVAPKVEGDPLLDKPWYKRPAVIIGGIAGLAVLGGLGFWAFK